MIVAVWTAADCADLRRAYQLPQGKFAQALPASERSVRGWEKGQRPVASNAQSLYATMYARAPRDVKDRFAVLRQPEDDVKRRDLLKAGVGAGALATLGVTDSERADWLLSGAGRPDMAAVQLMRGTLHQAMQLDDLLGSPAAQGMVIAQQQVTEAMLKDAPAALQPALLSLLAEWTGLAGSLAWDAQDYVTSGRLYTQAREFAHESEDSDLGAYMLCHLSQLATWQRRPRIAVDYVQAGDRGYSRCEAGAEPVAGGAGGRRGQCARRGCEAGRVDRPGGRARARYRLVRVAADA